MQYIHTSAGCNRKTRRLLAAKARSAKAKVSDLARAREADNAPLFTPARRLEEDGVVKYIER